MKKATIYDISKIAEVNPSTVSRALNDDSSISIKTKELVLKVARELNYHPNNYAAQLKSGRKSTVGVIVPYINHGLFSAVIQAIETALFPMGYSVIICQTHEEEIKEIQHINNLMANQVAGIFISVTNSTRNFDHYKKITRSGIPLIFFDRKVDVPGTSSVTVNDFQGSYMATQNLIDQGCRKIVHFEGNQLLEIYQNRLQGYLQALTDNRIPILKKYIVPCSSSIEAGKKALQRIWKADPQIDGICSSSDHAALGALQELKALHIKVPEQVAITGYSNEIFTQLVEIPVTSVEQVPNLMGKEAAKIFLEYHKAKDSTPFTIHKQLQPQLIIRKSSSRKNEIVKLI